MQKFSLLLKEPSHKYHQNLQGQDTCTGRKHCLQQYSCQPALEMPLIMQAVLLLFPETGEMDQAGEQALAILREFGLPSLIPVVVPPLEAPLKVRAACKKLASETLEAQVGNWQSPLVIDQELQVVPMMAHRPEAFIFFWHLTGKYGSQDSSMRYSKTTLLHCIFSKILLLGCHLWPCCQPILHSANLLVECGAPTQAANC